MKACTGLSNVVAGLIVAVAVAGTLSAIVWWARGQVSRVPTGVAEGVTVVAYRIGSDVVLVNYGYRSYTVRLISGSGGVCGSVQLQPRSSAVVSIATCDAGFVEVEGRLIRVVRVGG